MSTPASNEEGFLLPANCKQIFSYSQINSALDELADRLNRQLIGERPVALCVLQGGLIFSGQLIPRLNCMLEVDYIHATRYNNQTSGQGLAWKAYPVSDLASRTVLILDDILDEGDTLHAIIQYCEQQGAKKVIAAVLLRKHHDRCLQHPSINAALADNIALAVDDEYVFGFGMDYNGHYRQLPNIYALQGEGS
jgi:hypoxanthine phosphoribosyltransferase